MDKKDVLLQKSYEILVGLIESENAEEFVEESYAEIEDIIGFIVNKQEDSHLFRWEMNCFLRR